LEKSGRTTRKRKRQYEAFWIHSTPKTQAHHIALGHVNGSILLLCCLLSFLVFALVVVVVVLAVCRTAQRGMSARSKQGGLIIVLATAAAAHTILARLKPGLL